MNTGGEISGCQTVQFIDHNIDGLHKQTAKKKGEHRPDANADQQDHHNQRVPVDQAQTAFGDNVGVDHHKSKSAHHDQHRHQNRKNRTGKKQCQRHSGFPISSLVQVHLQVSVHKNLLKLSSPLYSPAPVPIRC